MASTDLSFPTDGVEIKYTVSGTQIDSAVASFGLSRADAERQTVHFFEAVDKGDEPRLRLLPAGVVLRLRVEDDGAGSSTAKLRPADPDELTGVWAAGSDHRGDYRIEYDWAAAPVLAASLDDDLKPRRIGGVLAGTEPIRQVFSSDQIAFLDECGPSHCGIFDGLSVAGPIHALRWKGIETGPFTGKLGIRAEQWNCDDLSFLEISVRVRDVTAAAALHEQLGAELNSRGLVPDTGSTKTSIVLNHLLLGNTPDA